MPEREPEAAYSILLEILRAHGLSWVAVQIQDQVRAGKPTTRMVAARAAPTFFDRFADETTDTRRRRRERLAATEPYSVEERLALALSALESAVIHTAEMEFEVTQFFHSGANTPGRVAFEPEEFEDAPRHEMVAVPVPRRQAVERLRQIVASLRQDLPDASH